MAQWNRTTLPTESDADEWGNILVLYENGQKVVYNWEDYVDDGMQEEGAAWMTLPQSDIPKTVSVTIEVGDRSYTIENNGSTIEVNDSRDPMGQPTCLESADTITGILVAVDGILQSELNDPCECERPDRRCGCEEHLDLSALTDADIVDILAGRGEAADLRHAAKEHLNSLRGNAESAIEAAYQRPRPWNKKK